MIYSHAQEASTIPEHPLGEWYLVGREMAIETDGIYKTFKYSPEEQLRELIPLLASLNVQVTDLKSEDYKLLKQGWTDFIQGLPAAYGMPADQSASKVVAELRGFHDFKIVVGQSGQLSPDDIEKLQAGVVRIKTKTGHGSGFFISPDYVLTNKHVVKDYQDVEITNDFSDIALQSRVVAKSREFDLALIRVENADKLSRIVLELGDSRSTKTGESITLFGYPLIANLTITTTFGRISARRPNTNHGECFQLSGAEANPGNSGGPLVNNNGQVIGILTFGFDHLTESKGFTFCQTIQQAVPFISNFCPEVLDNLK